MRKGIPTAIGLHHRSAFPRRIGMEKMEQEGLQAGSPVAPSTKNVGEVAGLLANTESTLANTSATLAAVERVSLGGGILDPGP